jgi:hypothetical protein
MLGGGLRLQVLLRRQGQWPQQQRLAVDLAIGGVGHLLQHLVEHRAHVVGQAAFGVLAQQRWASALCGWARKASTRRWGSITTATWANRRASRRQCSISSGSTRKPRIFTWLSRRPHSSMPWAVHLPISPVR